MQKLGKVLRRSSSVSCNDGKLGKKVIGNVQQHYQSILKTTEL